MRRASFQASLRLALAVCAVLPAACAQPAHQEAIADGRFDGVYAGTRTEEAACGGGQHAIVFHVASSAITVQSRHKHRRMSGTVSQDGSIALTDAYGERPVSGRISGDRLVATEAASASEGRHQQSGENDPSAPSCLWHFDALRTANAASGDGGPADQ